MRERSGSDEILTHFKLDRINLAKMMKRNVGERMQSKSTYICKWDHMDTLVVEYYRKVCRDS